MYLRADSLVLIHLIVPFEFKQTEKLYENRYFKKIKTVGLRDISRFPRLIQD